MAALSGAAMILPSSVTSAANESASGDVLKFSFRPDGKFKVMQLTDTHYVSGNPKSQRALRNIVEMLDMEKPDLVIHTGDVIWGNPAAQSFKELFQPLVDRGVPFVVALGNHDSDFELSRKEAFDVVRTIPGNKNSPLKEGVHGFSNDVIVLSSPNGVERAFYIFDTGNRIEYRGEKGYDYIRHSQIAWYRRCSEALTRANGDKPVPSMAFFHIPVKEFNDGVRDTRRSMIGYFSEEPCSSLYNSGLVANFKELGDVEAIVCGHDHDNDFVMKHGDMYYMYGRYSGGDTVYNHIGPSGARIFEFTNGEPGFRTYVRQFGKGVFQDVTLKRDVKSILRSAPKE